VKIFLLKSNLSFHVTSYLLKLPGFLSKILLKPKNKKRKIKIWLDFL